LLVQARFNCVEIFPAAGCDNLLELKAGVINRKAGSFIEASELEVAAEMLAENQVNSSTRTLIICMMLP